jgi:predicted acyltransferase
MQKKRLISLDVFRGLTIILMTIVNNPGDWGNVYPPLLHAEWHGCTPTDLVFPFFIFIVGVSVSFAIPEKIWNAGTFEKILVRSLRILCLGLFLNFFSKINLFGWEGIPLALARLLITIAISYALMAEFKGRTKLYLVLLIFFSLILLAFGGFEDFENVRIPGVLQRIGIVYFVTSVLYLLTGFKGQVAAAFFLLIFYWILMTQVQIPGFGAPNLNKGTNMAAWVDNALLEGHMYVVSKTWDPEGILSTIPAIASCIIGLLVGQLLNSSVPKLKKLQYMAGLGVVLLLAGILWDKSFPINKPLWTSSYVLFVSGLAILCLNVLYWLIEVLNLGKWTTFFVIWGVNPMIVFFYSGVIPRVLSMIKLTDPKDLNEHINLQAYLYEYRIARFFENPMNASLAGALTYVLIWTLILWIFYKNKLIFKV